MTSSHVAYCTFVFHVGRTLLCSGVLTRPCACRFPFEKVLKNIN